jgi:hypothetical protein
MSGGAAAGTARAIAAGCVAGFVLTFGVFAGPTVADRGTGAPASAALTAGAGRRSGLPVPGDGGAAPPTLAAALDAAGVPLPDGGALFGAVVHKDGAAGARFDEYEAGGGARADGFWPASAIKVLAAVGALEFLADLGFTGSASVAFDDDGEGNGDTWTVRDLVEAAVALSSNDAYDRLVEIAGVDWLNDEFLTPEHGFPDSVIQKSYVDAGPVESPAFTVTDGDVSVDVPPRVPSEDFGVPDGGNRSNLLELAMSVARVVLDADLPPGQRFSLDPADIADLQQSLLAADGFMRPGIDDVLGPDTLVYDKPGYVAGAACVDVAYIDAGDPARGYLLAVSVPDDGDECSTLAGIAEAAVRFLSTQP